MEWTLTLLVIFGGLVLLMATGMPVAFCFLLINVIGAFIFFGGTAGFQQLIFSIYSSLATFIMLPIVLYIFMGEVVFQTGVGILVIDSVDKWLGRLPGRLSILSVLAGTVLSTLTGASIASVALLGSTLCPEMEKRGYKKSMSLGPIMASGGLAVMIPPSGLAVFLGAVGEISIGKLLIAIIVPGLLMAAFYGIYIIFRCWFQPSIAPVYEVTNFSFYEKLRDTIRYILPVGIVVFMVVGIVFLGIATPSEAAAAGTIGAFILVLLNQRMTWVSMKKTFTGTLKVTGMILFIVAGAKSFSQILSFSGATTGLAELATSLPVSPIIIVIATQVVVLILGCFMDSASIMMITLPIFVPVVLALGFNSVWFATMYLINIETGLLTPPFGMNLFTMKAVASKDTTMKHIYTAVMPFVSFNVLAIALVLLFPNLALWLPGLMKR